MLTRRLHRVKYLPVEYLVSRGNMSVSLNANLLRVSGNFSGWSFETSLQKILHEKVKNYNATPPSCEIARIWHEQLKS